jgi:hypothetical protein
MYHDRTALPNASLWAKNMDAAKDIDKEMLPVWAASFPHLIQKRMSQLGFVSYLLNCPRNLHIELHKHGGSELKAHMLELFNNIVDKSQTPKEWQTSTYK